MYWNSIQLSVFSAILKKLFQLLALSIQTHFQQEMYFLVQIVAI